MNAKINNPAQDLNAIFKGINGAKSALPGMIETKSFPDGSECRFGPTEECWELQVVVVNQAALNMGPQGTKLLHVVAGFFEFGADIACGHPGRGGFKVAVRLESEDGKPLSIQGGACGALVERVNTILQQVMTLAKQNDYGLYIVSSNGERRLQKKRTPQAAQ